MKTENNKGKLLPLLPPVSGIWLSPEQAAKHFRNGKGISVATLMNKIYSGKLNGLVKHDHLGWRVFIPNHHLELKAA